MTRRGEQVRLAALEPLFLKAGFVPARVGWELERGDVRWGVFLSVLRKEGGYLYSVPVSADFIPAGDLAPLIHPGINQFPGAAEEGYRIEDYEDEDPLVVDVREVILPMIAQSRSATDVIDAWLDGNLGSAHWSRAYRISHGWSLAKRYGFDDQGARAERIVAEGRWSAFDRADFKYNGMPVRGWSTERRGPTWFQRTIEALG